MRLGGPTALVNQRRLIFPGRGFGGGIARVPAAGQRAEIQLHPDLLTGRLVIVWRVGISHSVAGAVNLYKNRALATTAIRLGVELDFRSATEAGQLRDSTLAALPGGAFMSVDVPAGTTLLLDLDEPIQLEEDGGGGANTLSVIDQTVDDILRVHFFYNVLFPG